MKFFDIEKRRRVLAERKRKEEKRAKEKEDMRNQRVPSKKPPPAPKQAKNKSAAFATKTKALSGRDKLPSPAVSRQVFSSSRSPIPVRLVGENTTEKASPASSISLTQTPMSQMSVEGSPVRKPDSKKSRTTIQIGDHDGDSSSDDEDFIELFHERERAKSMMANNDPTPTKHKKYESSTREENEWPGSIQGDKKLHLVDDDDDSDDDLCKVMSRAPQRKAGSSERKKKKPAAKLRSPQTARSLWSDTSMVQHGKRKSDSISKMKPDFEFPKFGPFELKPFVLSENHRVPASISRYLPNYQQVGVKFMYDRIVTDDNPGAILGDDMGLGKTIQVIALLSALLEKTGNDEDEDTIAYREKAAKNAMIGAQRMKDNAIAAGQVIAGETITLPDGLQPSWAPILIMVPPTLISNWLKDMSTWGFFSVAVYRGSRKEQSIARIKFGMAEILLCPVSMFQQDSDFITISEMKWKLVIVDEFHKFKNVKSKVSQHLRQLRDDSNCVVVGLTGTPMQNDHTELWNLVDLVAKDYLGPWTSFEREFARPIKVSRTKTASRAAILLGEEKAAVFSEKFFQLSLGRMKADVLQGELPNKDEKIIFCELSPLQKKIYRHIIKQPDFVLLSLANGPCQCGVNTKFFQEYQNLRTDADKIRYQREHKNQIIKRGKCCHNAPFDSTSPDGFDMGAVLWRKQHKNGPCENCPMCYALPALHYLYKLSSHVALLQASNSLEQCKKGTAQYAAVANELIVAKQFLPEDVIDQLPGKTLVRNDGIMDDHVQYSGKIAVLKKLLRHITKKQGRVLVFSYSTLTLNLIEHFVKAQGYAYLRMDGSTSTAKRDETIADFKRDPNNFIFLLSTKAMGLGLNLTEANYVIVFDVEWNPSWDEQAQDRAYRIGQEKDVTVFRLVSMGTIDEQKYLRQVYKTQLKQETIVETSDKRKKSARTFRGVAGDPFRKGELFGMANLLKFSDNCFMDYSSRESGENDYEIGGHRLEDVVECVKRQPEEEKLIEFDMFSNLALEKSKDDDQSDDEKDDADDSVVGGESQAVMSICNRVQLSPIQEDSDDGGSDEEMESPPADANTRNNDNRTSTARAQPNMRPAKSRNYMLMGKSRDQIKSSNAYQSRSLSQPTNRRAR